MFQPPGRGSSLSMGLLVALLVVAVIAIPGSVSATAASDPAAPMQASPTDIDPELIDRSDNVTVFVRFAANDTGAVDQPNVTEQSSGIEQSNPAVDPTVREPFDRLVDDTDGISLDRTYSIAPVSLVTVDTDRVSLESLLAVDGVVAIHADREVAVSMETTGDTEKAVEDAFGIDELATTERAPSTNVPQWNDSSSGIDAPSPMSASADQNAQSPMTTSADRLLAGQSSIDASSNLLGANTDQSIIHRSSDPVTPTLEYLRVPEAWGTFHARGEGTSVAVLDSGVDANHRDLTVDGWADFSVDPSPEPIVYHEHGTHVSGIVAGANGSGEYVGIAPDTSLYHGAVLTDCDERSCTGNESAIMDGIEWAVAQDVDAIVLSIGEVGYNRPSIDAIEAARAEGTVVVGAVGNDGNGTSASPANVYDAISVGAVDRSDSVVPYSSGEVIDTDDAWGSDAPDHWPSAYVVPDVVASGVGVTSTVPNDEHSSRSGTSMAAPHVAGLVALIQSATEATLDPDAIEAAIVDTAWKPDGEPPDRDPRYGAGIVDAHASIDHAGDHATIHGTVRDEVTGTALANATVTVTVDDETDDSPTGTPVSLLSDESASTGSFDSPASPAIPGTSLSVSESDATESTTDVVVGADRTTFELTTADDGSFALPGLWSERSYSVSVERTGYESTTATAHVPADETTTIDISMAGDAGITVSVTDEHFTTGVETASVSAVSADGTYPAYHVQNGTYLLAAVPGLGEYTLVIEADGYVSEERVLTIESAEHLDESVDLYGDATLEVTVESATGDSIENATVSIERGDGHRYEPTEMSDEAGTIALSVPGTGEPYTVEADAVGYVSNGTVTSPVDSGDTESVTLILSESADLMPGMGVTVAVVSITLLVFLVSSRSYRRRTEHDD